MTMVTQHESTRVRRQQIISAARTLIVKYGSEHVTVRRMADEIGVSEGAIYRHFKSKRDIISFLVDDIEGTLLRDLGKNAASKGGSLESLEKILISHISSIEQRKGVSFQVIAEIVSLGDKKLNKKIYGVINKYILQVKEILALGITEGVIQPELDLDAASTMFFNMIQGLVDIWALSQYSFKLRDRYKPLWDFYLRSIVKQG
jgi:AcrR family transcriptional regulator